VASAGGNEGVAPEVIARIEREIEAAVDQSDVGISVYKDPVTGKTTYHSDLTGRGLHSSTSSAQRKHFSCDTMSRSVCQS
jgi:hypothetical protein